MNKQFPCCLYEFGKVFFFLILKSELPLLIMINVKQKCQIFKIKYNGFLFFFTFMCFKKLREHIVLNLLKQFPKVKKSKSG